MQVQSLDSPDLDRLRSDYVPRDDLDMVFVLLEYLRAYKNRRSWRKSKGQPPHYLREGVFLDFHPGNVVSGYRFADEAFSAAERYLSCRGETCLVDVDEDEEEEEVWTTIPGWILIPAIVLSFLSGVLFVFMG